MGFLGMSGKTWKKIGGYALKAAPIVAAPFTGGASLLALGAGTGALSGALGGGGWKGALTGGALGAIPGFGAGGAAAGGVAKAGLKEIAKGVAKGAATNFATGAGTSLAMGQGVKNSLQAGGQGALTGLGTQGTGGFKQAAQQIGKNVATNVGGQSAAKGLQQAGVPGAIAGQGGNVFSDYLGKTFGGGGSFSQAAAGGGQQQPGISSFLPQQGAGTGFNLKNTLKQVGANALTGAAQGMAQRTTGGALPPTPGFAPAGPTAATASGGVRSHSKYAAAPEMPAQRQPAVDAAGQPAAQSSATGTDNERPASWSERYGPILAQGGGVVAGALIGRQAQKNAMQRSPEEQAALTGAQGAAGQLGKVGGELTQEGRDYSRAPGQYFQTLLGGNRAAMSQAVAGPTAQITSNYRGAERALDQQGIRGASRDVAAADLNRQRVSQIAGLTTGMQPYAAEQLAKMGQDTLQTGVGALGNAGNLYGNLLTQGSANRVYARKEGADTAAAIGGLARDVGEVAFRRPQGGVATSSKKKASSTTPNLPVTSGSGVPINTGPGVQLTPPPTPFGVRGAAAGPGDYSPTPLPFGVRGAAAGPSDYDPTRRVY